MNYLEALEQLQLLDIEQLTLLEQAHWRYVAFMGICCPDDSHQHQAILDRQTYPQWYTHTDTGHPRVTDGGVAGFMSAVSHMPPMSALPGMRSTFARPLARTSASAWRRGKPVNTLHTVVLTSWLLCLSATASTWDDIARLDAAKAARQDTSAQTRAADHPRFG